MLKCCCVLTEVFANEVVEGKVNCVEHDVFVVDRVFFFLDDGEDIIWERGASLPVLNEGEKVVLCCIDAVCVKRFGPVLNLCVPVSVPDTLSARTPFASVSNILVSDKEIDGDVNVLDSFVDALDNSLIVCFSWSILV